jgi:ABC-type nitrate/sulfonate/bicarbonate transport system substrate-binding protein
VSICCLCGNNLIPERVIMDRNVTRRVALKSAAAVAITGVAPSLASAQNSPAVVGNTKLTVTGYFRTPAFLIAEHKGLFSKERLEVDFHLVRLAPEHNAGLAEGRWPSTLSSIDTMLARTTQDGVDFVAFMEAEEGLSVQLVAKPEFKSLSDLRGKLFAADPVDSNYDLIRNKIMRDNGIAEDQYKIDILGNSSVRAAAFEAGKVDAAMLQPPFTARALAKGGIVLAEGADYVPNWPLVCGWGLRSWFANNRPTVVRFARAMASAADWLLMPENREETIQLIMKEEKQARERAETSYNYVVPKCMVRPESIRKNIELRIELGYYKPPHKSTEAFYDPSFVSEATGVPLPLPAGNPRNAVPA